MRYGPLSQFDITHLTDILDRSGVTDYSVEASPDDVAALDADRKDRAARNRSQAGAAQVPVMEYLYIDVPDSAVPLIAGLLENMGYGFVARGDEMQPDPEFDALVARKAQREAVQLHYLRWFAVAFIIAIAAVAWYGGWEPFREFLGAGGE